MLIAQNVGKCRIKLPNVGSPCRHAGGANRSAKPINRGPLKFAQIEIPFFEWVVWGFAVGCVAVPSVLGMTNALTWLLSWRLFEPLATLTYGAFLAHLIVIDIRWLCLAPLQHFQHLLTRIAHTHTHT